MSGGDGIGGVLFQGTLQAFLHGLGEFFEIDDVIDDGFDGVGTEGLEIGNEIIAFGHFEFGLFVEAAVDGIVGALKEAVLAIDREFVERHGETGGGGGIG